ncbi:uncharacterized protein LOC129761452 [Toxorhynchites rutilus septentrionalis]|uniref:uncharacterized protein LOC129761452 n=1 Tax=Toxorhynchites rutilus septentrionalis TaxID=329112 RepID=UPI0024797CEE|nr:uncharacterized protein LOC129761452 [Toxorhynchites rutilus septentrionalis]
MRKPLDQLQQFVRNRIAEIRKFTAECQWNYIRSQSNPADIVSRGQLPEALSQNYLWWNGPKFLEGPDYPVDEIAHVPDQLLPEITVVVATSTLSIEPLSFLHKHNNFRKLQRIMSHIIRFVDNCRQKNPLDRRKSNHHTVIELRRATDAIFKILQHIHLSDEIQRVLSNQPCKRIGNFRPVYNDGLLRVGGRLDHSTLPFASKHQIILPDKDPITKAFIRTIHEELLHVGQTGLINAIQQRYWLLNARSTVRKVTRSCIRCFRTNPTDTTQLMGSLPRSRVVPSPPFAVTGVDYAGPFWIKEGARRPRLIKAYVAVYVCMSTKAVHMEAVSNLTNDAFIASLKRLIGRRGLVQQIHSDNASNFRGAHHELNQIYRQFRNQQDLNRIQQFCQQREIEWHFIPPDAPEFGGLWEAAVKSAKTHLKRIAGTAKLTFEELATVLIEIEAVLNSRPLFTVSRDPADPQVITPAHFLIGRPLIALAEPSLENVKATRLDRWQHLQLMREHFWRAWTRDYLNTLQPRKKNLRTMPNLRPGMIVLLHDKNLPPLNWKLGRITCVYPGDDGLVRTVDVFANGSTYRRPITKVSVLPTEDNSNGSSLCH